MLGTDHEGFRICLICRCKVGKCSLKLTKLRRIYVSESFCCIDLILNGVYAFRGKISDPILVSKTRHRLLHGRKLLFHGLFHTLAELLPLSNVKIMIFRIISEFTTDEGLRFPCQRIKVPIKCLPGFFSRRIFFILDPFIVKCSASVFIIQGSLWVRIISDTNRRSQDELKPCDIFQFVHRPAHIDGVDLRLHFRKHCDISPCPGKIHFIQFFRARRL